MTTDSSPLITVFTLIFNSGEYVIPALNSLRKQTFTNYEHIIIDDASSDHSVKRIENWIRANRHSCKFIKNKNNQGITKNLNHIIKISKGRYLAGISDDLWRINRLQNQVNYIEKNNLDEFGILYSDCRIITSTGVLITESALGKYEVSKNKKDIIEGLIKDEITLPAPTFLYCKKVLIDLGGFDEKLPTEDFDSNIRIALQYPIICTPHNDVDYVRRKGQLSHSGLYKKFAIYRLKTFEKVLKSTNEYDILIFTEARKYIISCYSKNDKRYAIQWAKWYLDYQNNLIIRMYHSLMRWNFYGLVMRVIHQIVIRLKLL